MKDKHDLIGFLKANHAVVCEFEGFKHKHVWMHLAKRKHHTCWQKEDEDEDSCLEKFESLAEAVENCEGSFFHDHGLIETEQDTFRAHFGSACRRNKKTR